ncbi:CCD60 protein, partial [Rhinopomastus cyanomelas]|nr:CCD60 protein [Rhinopomastus cyanomelas]
RDHIRRVKQGKDYFHILHQESLERENARKAAQQNQDMRWRTEIQKPKFPDVGKSEEEINSSSPTEAHQLRKSENTKKITLRSFTPVYSSVLIPSPPEAKSEHLFQQLCAIHWLLEALTLEPNSSMHSIVTCWNPVDPGGRKKSVKEIEEEKLVTSMWNHFIESPEKFDSKAQDSPPIRKMKRMTLSDTSRLSSLSFPSGQSSHRNSIYIALGSEDNVKINATPSDVMSESAAAKEQQTLLPSLQKVTQIAPEAVSEGVHKQEDPVKTTGLQRSLYCWVLTTEWLPQGVHSNFLCCFSSSRKVSSFIKSKSSLCADKRQKFTAIREEAARCLHDILVSLERSQEEQCHQKHQSLEHVKHFRSDMERQLGMRPETKHDEDGPDWFSILLARLSESVKSDRCVQKILKKLEKYGTTPGLKIHPDTFLKVLADLQMWELCCPQIAAAVEFVRENIVQMPEEDFNEWFQARVA